MDATVQTLLLGLGGFGKNILEYLQNNKDIFVLPNDYHTLVFCNDTQPEQEVLPDFGTLFEKYERIVIFAGIGGRYSSRTLETILKQKNLKIEKFYIAVVSPFSFEKKTNQRRARLILSKIIASKIGCGIFANSEVLNRMNSDVNKAFEDFHKKIIESIAW